MKIGIIAVQGAVTEHINAVKRALSEPDTEGDTLPIRKEKDLDDIDGLVIPGGESTTISKYLKRLNMFDKIKNLAMDGLPIMGTCAGCILLAKEGDAEVEKTDTELLGLMDMAVDRNSFGRQRESFETEIEIKGFNSPYHAVFIRAPVIKRVWGDCEVLASIDEGIVMVKQDNMLATTFHPELTQDLRLHKLLLELI